LAFKLNLFGQGQGLWVRFKRLYKKKIEKCRGKNIINWYEWTATEDDNIFFIYTI